MDDVLHRTWTTDAFLAWEDQQEGKHEFDGQDIVPMTGGSVAHQEIVLNVCVALKALLAGQPFMVLQEMRLRADPAVRYPDVVVCPGLLHRRTRTLTDAVAIFEVLSDDTARTDREKKLHDYAMLRSLRAYVLLEQESIGATMFRREPGGAWVESWRTDGALALPGLDIALPLADAYRGLTF